MGCNNQANSLYAHISFCPGVPHALSTGLSIIITTLQMGKLRHGLGKQLAKHLQSWEWGPNPQHYLLEHD